MKFQLLTILALLSIVEPAFSQKAPEPPPTPDAERATFTVADGFEVTLFASEPMLAKPIQMSFDAKGRLWVASSSVYPQVKPGEMPDDKIVVLEDIDADGKADKSTVFAEGLLIPTGIEPGDGGAYVANSTEIVHFRDDNDDLKADGYRVVLSGFGTEDTHHIIHSFRWGFDGRLYFIQSIYIHSHIETPHGVMRLGGSGIWRYRPEEEKLEIFARGMINPWGHTWDRWGTSFATDGAGDGGIHYVFPGATYASAVGIGKILQGLNRGSPKYCGAELVNGRHLPDDWQGDIIANDFRANRVCRFKISDTPNGFVSKQMPDVITSKSRFFRPVDVKLGPDGAIYIADWCNEIINHGEVDFRDPRRDKIHGRIWRVAAKNRPFVQRPKIVGAPVEQLLELLKEPEDWTRHHAKLQLRAAGAEKVLPALATWVKKLEKKHEDYEHLRTEALWVYQALDVVEPDLLGSLLKSKNHRARAAAMRVVPDWQRRLPNTTDLLAAGVADESLQVRIEAVRGLARVPDVRSVEIAMRALEKPVEHFMDFALWMTANELKPHWLPQFSAGRLSFGGRSDQMSWALRAVKSPDALKNLIAQLKSGKVPPNERGDLFDLIAAVGNAEDARAVFDVAIAADGDAGLRARALAALDRAARQRSVTPAGADGSKLAESLAAKDDVVRAAAMRLAGAWKAADVRTAIADAAAAPDTPDGVRRAAMGALADYGPESAEALRKLAGGNDRTYEARLMAIAALASIELPGAARIAADLLASGPSNADPTTAIAAFLQREGGGEALAGALKGNKLSPDVAKLALRHINTTGRDAGPLVGVLREAAGLDATATVPSESEVKALMDEVMKSGDPARGEVVFRRADTGCYGCHAIGGAGAQVGPDLRAIGAASPLDYVIESILAPGKAIKDGYQSVIVATKTGDVFSGIKVTQDDKQIVLRDATHDNIVVPLASVSRQRDGGSLMPIGLADALTRQEFLDLARFLSELGKPGPFAVDQKPLVRRWRVLDPGSAEAALNQPVLLESTGSSDRLGWGTAYSLISGELPNDALPAATSKPVAFAQCQIEVTAPGRVGIHVDSPQGLKVWIDGGPIEVKEDMAPELAAGIHTLTFQVDKSSRGEKGLRVQLLPAEGSAAAAQPLAGK